MPADIADTPGISVSTAAYDGYGFDQILPSMARCGVKRVEFAFIDGYVEAFTDDDLTRAWAGDLKDEMRRHGQQCRYFSGHIDLGLADACERLEARCRFAAELGAGFVISNAAAIRHQATFFGHAERLAAIARHHGVRILLENPGNAEPNLLDHSAHIEPLLDRLDRDVFGINFDLGNLLSHQPDLDPVDEALAAIAHTDHFHIKSCRKVSGGFDFTDLGLGDIDDGKVIKALVQRGRPFSLELPFRLHRDRDAQPWRDPEAIPLEVIEARLNRSLQWLNNTINSRS